MATTRKNRVRWLQRSWKYSRRKEKEYFRCGDREQGGRILYSELVAMPRKKIKVVQKKPVFHESSKLQLRPKVNETCRAEAGDRAGFLG